MSDASGRARQNGPDWAKSPRDLVIYKILLPSEWAQFEARGHFTGSPFDVSSGFIHCSSRAQVGAPARRVFPDDQALVVVALEAETLSDAVRWESVPDGGTFPHVYAPLPIGAVAAVYHVAGAGQVDALIRDT
jgi:uncharacterized protein (DUF952 family)